MKKPGGQALWAQEQHMLSPWGRNGLSTFKEQGRCGRRCMREMGREVRQRAPRFFKAGCVHAGCVGCGDA